MSISDVVIWGVRSISECLKQFFFTIFKIMNKRFWIDGDLQILFCVRESLFGLFKWIYFGNSFVFEFVKKFMA